MQGAFDRRHFSLLTSSKSRLANSRLPAKVNHRVQHNPTLHPSANRRQSSPAPRAALCALVSLSDLLAEFKEHRPVPPGCSPFSTYAQLRERASQKVPV